MKGLHIALMSACVLWTPRLYAANSCNTRDFVNLTGKASTTITFAPYAYTPKCVHVDPNTAVSFSGAFSQHPLRGGEIVNGTAVPDSTSPIASTSSGATVTFQISSPGVYGFYCAYHGVSFGMNGVVEVGNEIIFADGFE